MVLHVDLTAENAAARRRGCGDGYADQATFRQGRAKRGILAVVFSAIALLGIFFASSSAQAEYGDMVINRQSETFGQRPVIFSHTFHRMRFQCRVCHTELGIKMRAASNNLTMFDMAQGRYCGACHNDNIAWGLDNCGLCHSGKAGLRQGVVGSHKTRGPGVW